MSALLLALALVLVGGRIAARTASRVGLPPLFGELVLGLVLGPFLAQWLQGGNTIELLGTLGMILLMLLAGLETDLSVFRGVALPGILVAAFGALLPAATGSLLMFWLGGSLPVSLFVGVALSATSVAITAATLRETGRLQSTAGRTIMIAAVVDDVLGLLLLAFVTGSAGGEPPQVAVLRVAVTGGMVILAAFLLGPLLRLLERHVETFLPVALGVGFLFAWGAQAIGGLAPITGAYVAGLLLARAMPHQPVAHHVETLASGFFATMFFMSLGLRVRLFAIAPALLAVFLLLAVVTKVAGCGLGARLGGLGWDDVLTVGVGMIPRGEVALIVASIGYDRGILSTSMFSLLVLVAIGTTVVTPPLLNGISALGRRTGASLAVEPEEMPVAS